MVNRTIFVRIANDTSIIALYVLAYQIAERVRCMSVSASGL
jgi:hypothetical protein